MATKVGGFPSNGRTHLENIKATSSQIPTHFGNCSKTFFCFVFILVACLSSNSLPDFFCLGWFCGWLDGGAEGVGLLYNFSRRLAWSKACWSEREGESERESKQAVQSWNGAQCRGGGMCQQRTPPTLSILRACGVSLVDVVSVGVGEVGRERGKMDGGREWKRLSVLQSNIQRRGKGQKFRLEV